MLPLRSSCKAPSTSILPTASYSVSKGENEAARPKIATHIYRWHKSQEQPQHQIPELSSPYPFARLFQTYRLCKSTAHSVGMWSMKYKCHIDCMVCGNIMSVLFFSQHRERFAQIRELGRLDNKLLQPIRRYLFMPDTNGLPQARNS
jgi:hypothetical protein